jgi:HPt (histidine-containing phosphotransfer) domain-containing protein
MAKSAASIALCSSDDSREMRSAPVSTPCCASANNPVDLVHLSRQSLGDRSLELEILQLFHSQSQLYLGRLQNAKTADERRFAAHTVIGSARGLGAWRVAAEAEAVEKFCARGCDISALSDAVQEANLYIEELLADN